MNDVALPLTDQELKFARQLLYGMNPSQAAKAAGYPTPEKDARRLLKQGNVVQFLQAEQEKYRDISGVDRQEIIDGMRESIEMAKLMSDPQTMLIGWRELAKLCGLYAPEKKQIDVNVTGKLTVAQMETLSDDELVKLIRNEADTYEGEATHVEED